MAPVKVNKLAHDNPKLETAAPTELTSETIGTWEAEAEAVVVTSERVVTANGASLALFAKSNPTSTPKSATNAPLTMLTYPVAVEVTTSVKGQYVVKVVVMSETVSVTVFTFTPVLVVLV